uniref:Uncharacterized protein n=1 Tax=Panagrolaimus sp. JU765 TaxID=591449 RepID=A0AC34Q3M3_9BILA
MLSFKLFKSSSLLSISRTFASTTTSSPEVGNHDLFEREVYLENRTSQTGVDYHKKLFAKCSELMSFVQHMQLPVIAEVDGVAAAAGCQLVSSCDVVVASPKSTFMVPGQKVGLFCSTPGIALVRTVSRKIAMDMLLTARSITAQG